MLVVDKLGKPVRTLKKLHCLATFNFCRFRGTMFLTPTSPTHYISETVSENSQTSHWASFCEEFEYLDKS